MTALWRLDAKQLTQGYRNGDFTPGEVLEAVLSHVAECQPHINAVKLIDKVSAKLASSASRLRWARGTPLGPLDGVPVSLKDNLHAAGEATGWGSDLLKGFVARKDETSVARLRAQGALIFGKTNLPEFAMQGYTANPVAGVTRNPWNPALTPGGSSGGAAAAVASGCGPLALATDAGGSIRRPAAYCNLVGFKPSAGRVPREGGLPAIFLGYETVGGIGRTVEDVTALMQIVSDGLAAEDPAPARILYVPRFGDHPVDPGIASAVAQAAARWQALGHQVDEASSFDLADDVNRLWPILGNIGLAWMMDHAQTQIEFGLHPGDKLDTTRCGPEIQERLKAGRETGAMMLFDLLQSVRTLESRLDERFAQYDFLLTPAVAAMPWAADQPHPDEIAGRPAQPRDHAVFTPFANAAGLPAVALPSGFVDGLPTGFQLVGRRGADARVLAMARQYEAAHPWAAHWPPVAQPATA